MNTKKCNNPSAFTFRQGFTIIEILVVAPIVILVIGTFISAIVSMTGEVLVSRGTALLSYNIQDALNRIEQDIITSGAYLATNNITVVSPQGYNDDASSFHNADATNGTSLILNSYATTENPLSPARNIIYVPDTPNSCSSELINANTPFMMNTVYFVKNNTLWRRTIAPGNYATTGCSIPWQQPSCAPGVTNAFCKTQDIRLVDGIQSGGFSVGYYPSPISTAASSIASDSAQTDAARLAALQTNSTAVVTITATSAIAGRSVTQTGTIRAISPNNTIQTIVTSGLVLNLDAGNPGSYPGSGTIWTDLSGNGNNGTLMNGVSYTNNNDGATVLDGVDDYVEIANPLSIFSSSFTMSMWIYLNGAAERDILIGDYAIAGGINVNFERSSDNQLRLYWNASPDINTAGGVVSTGQWQNVIVVRDKVLSKVQFYVNNAKVLDYSGSLSDKVATGKHYIGKDSRNGSTAFNGLISDVSIYNKALSASEVQQNFNALRGRYGI